MSKGVPSEVEKSMASLRFTRIGKNNPFLSIEENKHSEMRTVSNLSIEPKWQHPLTKVVVKKERYINETNFK